jgi:hypothetical protein
LVVVEHVAEGACVTYAIGADVLSSAGVSVAVVLIAE